MQIQLNGTPHTAKPAQTIAELLTELGLAGKRIAIEVNQEIVPASSHATTSLQEGDIVEVVQAIGGG